MTVEKSTLETEVCERKVRNSILDSFTLLHNKKNDGSKITGGVKLLSFFMRNQQNEKELQYALKRLIRGVGSSSQSSRTGFFSTLVVMLWKIEKLTITDLMKIVKLELHVSAGTKSETGDVATGKILVCGAILRSGLVFRATDHEQTEVIKMLFAASAKKSYLNTAAYLFLVDFMNTLDEVQFKTIVWSNVKPEVAKPITDQSLDSIYFLLAAKSKFGDAVNVKKLIGVKQIICEDSIHDICDKLMGALDYNTTNHPIYELIGETIANSELLHLFWTSGIDSHLTKHNRNRELVAIKLLNTIFKNMTQNYEVITELLSKNFFFLLMDWFKGLQTVSKCRNKRDDEDEKKAVIKKAKEMLDSLVKVLKSEGVESEVKVNVLKKLLFYPGDLNFSEITGTSIVRSIMADLDSSGVKTMARLFKDVLLNKSKKFIKEDVERNWHTAERLKAAEALSGLLAHRNVTEDTPWRLKYMRILMCFGFFKITDDEEIAVSSELSTGIKNCFFRSLGAKMPTIESLVEILRRLCEFIDENMSKEDVIKKQQKHVPKESQECWKVMFNLCKRIESNKDQKNTKVDNVFLILLYQLGLFLFSDPKYVEMSRGSIKELESCYEHYKKDKRDKKNKLKEGDLYDEDPEWIEVLVEVLLTILSHDSHVLRSIVQCVFSLLWQHVTPSAMGQIVSVLDPDSDSNPLAQDSDSDDDSQYDSDESDIEDGESKSNNKQQNGKEDEDDSEKSDVESEIQIPSEASDNDEDKMKVPDQLRMAVRKALGGAAPDTDTESVDADMIDEEEGKKLDDALAEAFKILRQGKKQKTKKDRKDKKTLADFRVRVLDLINIYLEKEPSMEMCLAMMAPLMRCLEFSLQDNDQKQVENRVRKTLKSLTKLKKFSSVEDVTVEILCDYLKATIEKGIRSNFVFQAIGDMVTECGTFIVQCSQKLNDPETPSKKKKGNSHSPFIIIYKDALTSFFTNRNCLLPVIFFHSILQTEWDGNLVLLPIIVQYAFSGSVRLFKRHEALDMLSVYYKNLKRIKPQNICTKLVATEKLLEESVKRVFDETNTDFVVKDKFFKGLSRLQNDIQAFYNSVNGKSVIDFKSISEVVTVGKKKMKTKRVTDDNVAFKESSDVTKQVANSDNVNKSKKRKKNASISENDGQINVQKKQKSSGIILHH